MSTESSVEAMDAELKVFSVFFGCLGALGIVLAGRAISHSIRDNPSPRLVELPSSAPSADRPHGWYIADQDFKSCIKTNAPAKKIEFLRMGGGDASTNESRDNTGNLISVEVSAPSADGLHSTVWTYYTSLDACQAELRYRNYIPDEYR